jgi:hypothetical protein
MHTHTIGLRVTRLLQCLRTPNNSVNVVNRYFADPFDGQLFGAACRPAPGVSPRIQRSFDD